MALTNNKIRRYYCVYSDEQIRPAKFDTKYTIYEGSILGLNPATGLARPLVSGDLFLGIAHKFAGLKGLFNQMEYVDILNGHDEWFYDASPDITKLNQSAYATDDSTITFTRSSLYSYIGTVTQVVSDGYFIRIENISDELVNAINGLERITALEAINTNTKEPTGFITRETSEISYDNTSRVFTIEPKSPATEFSFYSLGTLYTKSTAQTVTLTATVGAWFIYFNTSGVLTASQTPWDFDSGKVFVSVLYYNGTDTLFGDERHGCTMDGATHEYLHNTVGARYENGFGISGYTLNTNTNAAVSIGLTSGSIADEDIEIIVTDDPTPTPPFEQILTDPAQIPVLYREGIAGTWMKQTASDYVAINTVSGRLNYNTIVGSDWDQVECTNNYYMAYWIICTNNVNEPIMAIQGQREDSKLEDAIANNSFNSLSFGSLPFQEITTLYRIIYQTKDAYTNDIEATIQDVADFRNVSSVRGAAAAPAQDHSSLSGLHTSGHPASIISYDPSSTGIASTIVTAQDAINYVSSQSGRFTLQPLDHESVTQGTWVGGTHTTQQYNHYMFNSSQSDGDQIDYKAYMTKGTWKCRVLGTTNTTHGIFDIKVNGTTVHTIDGYSAANTFNVRDTSSEFNITSDGLKTISVVINGKNASATTYYAFITYITFWRTA